MIEVLEAKKCLNCKTPRCVEACPINNKIPDFISKIKEEKYEEAYKIIRMVNPLGAICGRVCPHENQCQGSCVRGIKNEPIPIGRLEAEVCDWARKNNIKMNYDIMENEIKVAVIGAGPAGIACSVELRKLGYDVTIFEKECYMGGILMYGIPEYRLPKEIVQDTLKDLLEVGIKVKFNTILIKEGATVPNYKSTVSINSLFEDGYSAIFIGIGTEISNILPIKGCDSYGVIGANEFLKSKRNCFKKSVAVVGGGNVAMDAARVAKKEGADVTVIYRKQKENMPACKAEVDEAEKEGIRFIFGTNLTRITAKDDTRLLLESDTNKIYEVDTLVMAIGSVFNANCIDDRFNVSKQGLLEVDENFETSIKNVFAGGDIVQKKATVCMAIKNGKDAAKAIDYKMKNINK